MTDGTDDRLTPEEQRALRGMRDGPGPSPALEERTVEALRSAGFLAPRRSVRLWPTVVSALAASIVCFMVGIAVGRAGGVTVGDTARADGREFLLLLHPSASFDTSIPESSLIEEYRAWARDLAESGLLVHAEKLQDSGTLLAGGPAGIDERTIDLDVAVGGFFLIRTDTVAEAAAVARTCPHLSHGGIVELRAIDHGPSM